jgi:hypothetical protein
MEAIGENFLDDTMLVYDTGLMSLIDGVLTINFEPDTVSLSSLAIDADGNSTISIDGETVAVSGISENID